MLLIGPFEGNTREWLAYLLGCSFYQSVSLLDSSLVWCIFLYHYGHQELEQKKKKSETYWILDVFSHEFLGV